MKLGEFVGHLEGKDGLDLEFTVSGRRISGSYHITEIKSARIESVDCGGTQNRWTEVVFQLLEPGQDDLGPVVLEPVRDQHAALRVEQCDADIRPIGFVVGHGRRRLLRQQMAEVRNRFLQPVFHRNLRLPAEF